MQLLCISSMQLSRHQIGNRTFTTIYVIFRENATRRAFVPGNHKKPNPKTGFG